MAKKNKLKIDLKEKQLVKATRNIVVQTPPENFKLLVLCWQGCSGEGCSKVAMVTLRQKIFLSSLVATLTAVSPFTPLSPPLSLQDCQLQDVSITTIVKSQPRFKKKKVFQNIFLYIFIRKPCPSPEPCIAFLKASASFKASKLSAGFNVPRNGGWRRKREKKRIKTIIKSRKNKLSLCLFSWSAGELFSVEGKLLHS